MITKPSLWFKGYRYLCTVKLYFGRSKTLSVKKNIKLELGRDYAMIDRRRAARKNSDIIAAWGGIDNCYIEEKAGYFPTYSIYGHIDHKPTK